MAKITKKQMICKTMATEIVEEAEYILEDHTIPKNVIMVIRKVKDKLNNDLCSLEVSTILYELEETINNMNATECRTVVWGLISKLETLKEKIKWILILTNMQMKRV